MDRTTVPTSAFARALLVSLLLLVSSPAAALAHAELERSTPPDGATVESPFDGPIVMDFTEALAAGSEGTLIGPNGSTVASATVDGAEARMTIALEDALAPGDYVVRWVGIAEDEHVERGTFTLTVSSPPPTAEPTPTREASASPAATPPPTPSPEPSTQAPPTPDPSTAAGAGDVILPIIVALVVVGGGAAYLLTRRRPTNP